MDEHSNFDYMVRSDWERYKLGKFSKPRLLLIIVFKSHFSGNALSFAFLFWLRLYQNGSGFGKYYSRLKLARFSIKYGIEISRFARLGSGAYFAHIAAGIVFRGNLIVGKNLTCMHNVTIGNDGRTSDSITKIGDNCYIGAGAKIFGGIEIGQNVRIGGGAVVVADVPDNATVVGVPARVISISEKS